jgi:CDP-paratose 2-epimerase
MSDPVVIIGGAGFIGCNLAAALAGSGERVRIYDDLSRPGVDANLAWLGKTFGAKIDAVVADVRDRATLRNALHDAQAVFHFAAQVAVTTSMAEPRHDFDVNAGGTLEVLEALRARREPPPLVFTSTNKVYGCLDDIAMRIAGERWVPVDEGSHRGIAEDRPLDFRTPYGCSKGCADQYVLDYARSFGLPACVFRMSCIYGPHQLGTEDQGWVAHFLRCAIAGAPITIYGDGRQVRDVLYVDDLVDAFVRARRDIRALSGRAFNIGGGPDRAISLRELVDRIGELSGEPPELAFAEWRPGDQRYYVSDTAAFTQATGWRPRVGPGAGIEALHGWLAANRGGHA